MVKASFAAVRSLVWVALVAGCFSAPASGQEQEKLSPRQIRGQIVEMDGSAIADAQVKWSLASWDEAYGERLVHARGELLSAEDGTFELRVDEAIPKDRDLYLNVSAGTKVHFARSFDFDGDTVWQESVDLGKVQLDRGVRVKGRVVSPDGSATILENPIVSLYSDDGLVYGSRETHFYRDLSCDSDGNFECLVPNNNKLNLLLAADNFAQTEIDKEVALPTSSDQNEIPELDLGAIKLEAGVSIVGVAERLDGSPAKGVIVTIAEWAGSGSSLEVKSDQFEYKQLGHRSFAKTDEKGNFRLPPHQGKCTVLVLSHGSSRKVVDGEREVLKADGKVPFFEPVDVDLEAKGREVIVKLREVESVEVSGTVYDAKGKPVSKALIQHAWYCVFGPVEYKKTYTDKNGNYSFRIGKGFRPEVNLFHDGQDVAYVTAETVEDYPELFFGSGKKESPEFRAVKKDIAYLNWELLPQESKSNSALSRVGNAAKWLFSDE